MDVDLPRLGADLAAAFPALAPITPLTLLGLGFRSQAVATAEDWVFRIGRHPAAALGYAREAALLPTLHTRLPVAVPHPTLPPGPTPAFPFGVMGYPRLPGTPPDPALLPLAQHDSLVAGVAAFLLALHRVPLAALPPLPRLDNQADSRAALGATVLPTLHMLLDAQEYARVARWWDTFLSDPRMGQYTPTLRHGDLWQENMLVDAEGRLVGVLDFEEAGLGDPAQDFATLRHLGAPFAAAVETAYRAAGGIFDAGFAHRRERLWELREFDGLAWVIRAEDAAETADAVRKLRSGPILAGR